ncbi:YHS domain-containing (seleno)protein [Fulvivirgaceae bacterium BMA10]|uniref:YHS domain-containing (Seleno)protein n=1 Tax=Splendidivirga corallicola TaxID=3051826 RepID=A0ABT8KTB3_9BACT|nr:YHS domain-containing (seleno)protein [Fulvivirgaceae bacterium BMA10]
MKKIKYLILLEILCCITIRGFSQETASKRIEHFNLNDTKVAIKGWDVVSYFNQKEPSEGNSNFKHTYNGVTYWFKNQGNKDLFVANPEKYEPSYGGWCSYAMGNTGEKVEVDPETYKIINGKLNLFYNFYFNNTLKKWNKNETNLKKKADNNWDKIFKGSK